MRPGLAQRAAGIELRDTAAVARRSMTLRKAAVSKSCYGGDATIPNTEGTPGPESGRRRAE